MWSKVVASLGLLLCIGIAVHMSLSPRLRAAWAKRLSSVRQRVHRRQLARSSSAERLRELAAREEARAVIERAKSGVKPEGEWDGNVYHPKQFGKTPRKPH